MADDIENHTLRLLQEMRAEMRQGFADLRQRADGHEQRLEALEGRMESMEGRQLSIEGSIVKVIDAVTEIAKVQEKHSAILIELVESGGITGSRLNAVEGRLACIEAHARFVPG